MVVVIPIVCRGFFHRSLDLRITAASQAPGRSGRIQELSELGGDPRGGNRIAEAFGADGDESCACPEQIESITPGLHSSHTDQRDRGGL